jgi:hypothetical protein
MMLNRPVVRVIPPSRRGIRSRRYRKRILKDTDSNVAHRVVHIRQVSNNGHAIGPVPPAAGIPDAAGGVVPCLQRSEGRLRACGRRCGRDGGDENKEEAFEEHFACVMLGFQGRVSSLSLPLEMQMMYQLREKGPECTMHTCQGWDILSGKICAVTHNDLHARRNIV